MSKRSQCHRQSQIAAAGLAALAVITMANTAHAHKVVGPDPNLPIAPIGDSVIESATGFDAVVAGRIPSHCSLGKGADIDLGELSGGITVDAGLGLKCNVPFELSIRAAHGGITHTTRPMGEGGFTGRLFYDLGIELPLLSPAPRVEARQYQSQQLLAGVSISSANSIAVEGLSLRIQTKRPEGHGLLAGEYSEAITFTITPRM
ncbi:MAG: hypothetical protein ACRYFE_02315 [Janthinobacterium lividum]